MRNFGSRIVFAIGTSLFVAGCSSGSVSPLAVPPAQGLSASGRARYVPPAKPAPVANVDIDKHIDASLPKHDRKIVHQLMQDLRPEDRYNVGFFAKDGTNYASTKAVYATMRRWKSTDGLHFIGDGGKPFIGPLLDTPQSVKALSSGAASKTSAGMQRPLGYEVPTPSDANGPFRRVYSDAGYSRETGNIYLPCGATNFQELTGQTGYIYAGGFGQNNDGLDAGFQYSIANDWYTLFSRDSGTDGPNQMNAQGGHFACGQTVSYDLYSTPDPTYGLITVIVGNGNDTNGTPITESVMDPSNPDGFPQNGNGVRLKRMTTIAQGANDFSNGSTFGISALDGTPQVVWTYCNIGVYDPSNNMNSIFVWANGNGNTQNYPDDATKIVVTYSDMADETDGINLHP